MHHTAHRTRRSENSMSSLEKHSEHGNVWAKQLSGEPVVNAGRQKSMDLARALSGNAEDILPRLELTPESKKRPKIPPEQSLIAAAGAMSHDSLPTGKGKVEFKHGRISTISYPAGLTRAFSYDPLGNVAGINETAAGGKRSTVFTKTSSGDQETWSMQGYVNKVDLTGKVIGRRRAGAPLALDTRICLEPGGVLQLTDRGQTNTRFHSNGATEVVKPSAVPSAPPEVAMSAAPTRPETAQSKLNDTLNSSQLGVADRSDMLNNVAAFVSRAQREGISAQSVDQSLDSINRMLTMTDTVVSKDLQMLAVKATLYNLADVQHISQGFNSDCTAASIEISLVKEHPELYTNIIKQSLTGTFRSPDGVKVDLDPSCLMPDGESNNYPNLPYQRNFASQLAQTTMLSDLFKHQNPQAKYFRVPARPPADTGERVMNADGSVTEFTGINVDEFDRMEDRLTDTDESLLRTAKDTIDQRGAKFDTFEDFQIKLMDLVQYGPMMIPIRTVGSANLNHVVVVSDVSDERREAFVINPWGPTGPNGERFTGWVSLPSLYAAADIPSSSSGSARNAMVA